MKRKFITLKNKYCTVWLLLSCIYFISFHFLYLWDCAQTHHGYDGILTIFVFILSSPIFSAISGWLGYKGTTKVFLPSLITTLIMVVVYLPIFLGEAQHSYEQSLRYVPNTPSYLECLLEYIPSLLIMASPIFVMTLISSAITKFIVRKKSTAKDITE